MSRRGGSQLLVSHVGVRASGRKVTASACIVCDIGGTHFRAGVLSWAHGLLKPLVSFPSPSYVQHKNLSTRELQDLLIDKILSTVAFLRNAHPALDLQTIGIAVPGPTTGDGIVRSAPPLWGSKGGAYPLKRLVEAKARIRCCVMNDMTAVATWYGSLPQFARHRWICVVTVSTGIGNKVIDTKTKEPILDSGGLSGEIGHVTVGQEKQAILCDCGGLNHVSGIASGRGVERFARAWARTNRSAFLRSLLARLSYRQPDMITAEHVALAVKANDEAALEILDAVTRPLAEALSIVVGSVGVEKIVIVGGFALGVGPRYLTALQNHMLRLGSFGRGPKAIRQLCCLGKKDDTVGLKGAGLQVRTQLHGPGCREAHIRLW